MKILVTGTRGQVAQSLAEASLGWPGMTVEFVGRPELDMADPASIRRAVTRRSPDLVVNAAAYTAVDRAEDEEPLAHAVNATGAGAVAAAAADIGVPIVHLSTDYVFAGDSGRPYTETDRTGPRNAYGRTKLAGEGAVAAANPRHVILRTAWVYSPFGRNFVVAMLALARQQEAVSVVSDQWGNPTSALDLADAILHVAAKTGATTGSSGDFGIFHLAGDGSTNWSGFAAGIFGISRDLGGPSARVLEIGGASYAGKAVRPANSRLDSARFAQTFGWRSPPWQGSCKLVVRRLLHGAAGR